jgi:exodeoxyribonuclease VII small subunit
VPDDPDAPADTDDTADTRADPVTSAEQDRPSYEQARAELAEVVQRLETGGATLEESLLLWERGEQLATICQDWLDGARARLTAAAKLDRPAAADE